VNKTDPRNEPITFDRVMEQFPLTPELYDTAPKCVKCRRALYDNCDGTMYCVYEECEAFLLGKKNLEDKTEPRK
jgi:hypothetical protein